MSSRSRPLGQPGGVIVAAAGPQSSGTRLLHRILNTGSVLTKAAYHWPLPFRNLWWEAERHLGPEVLVVVIFRDRDMTCRSLVRAGHVADLAEAEAQHDRALAELADLLATRARSMKVRYEDLIAQPDATIAGIDAWLRQWGYDGAPLSVPEPVFDGNEKYELGLV